LDAGVPADTLFASGAVLLVTPRLSIGMDLPAYTLGWRAALADARHKVSTATGNLSGT
jgi:hypothetical protein